MNKDVALRLLVLVALALLAYIAWMNTKEIVDLELELDKMKGALGGVPVVNPVPPAEKTLGSIPGGSFEDSLRG